VIARVAVAVGAGGAAGSPPKQAPIIDASTSTPTHRPKRCCKSIGRQNTQQLIFQHDNRPNAKYNADMQIYSSWLYQLYAWACRRLYDEFAWSYDWVSLLVSLGRWPVWRRHALAFLPTPQTTASAPRVLELGFGTGELLVELAQRGIFPVGLDPSPAMHQITGVKLRRANLAAGLVCAKAQAMPFDDGSFDLILSTFPAEYILHEQTLYECARLLKPGPQTTSGNRRLVVVGLWVRLRSSVLRRLIPLFYGEPSAAWLKHVEQRLVSPANGLSSMTTLRRSPFW
jgi:ubiquinone/menaquinone biosynthesis C-methylase UbiE